MLCEIAGAVLTNAQIGSTDILFTASPDGRFPVRAGAMVSHNLERDIGTAGAITLIVQTVLPFLSVKSPASMRLTLIGGTNVSFSPPFDHLQHVLIPLLNNNFGITANAAVVRRGYYPVGMGKVEIDTTPTGRPLPPISLIDRGSITAASYIVYGDGPNLSAIVLGEIYSCVDMKVENYLRSVGLVGVPVAKTFDARESKADANSRQGNVKSRGKGRNNTTSLGMMFWLKTDTGCILQSNSLLVEKDSSKIAVEEMTKEVFSEMTLLLESQACVDEHTADQLLIFMALAAGTSRIIVAPKSEKSSQHIESAIHIASLFTGCSFELTTTENGCRSIACTGQPSNISDVNNSK